VTRRTKKPLAGLIGILSMFAATAAAHRLDEYLQASRLLLARDRVVLEMDLTPGVDVAPMIFSLINKNRNGRISEAEGRAYANQVLKEVLLEVDGRRQRLDLVRYEFPAFQEMSAGEGPIRIEARAAWAGAAGQHLLFYRNDHQPGVGVYLVNALRPESNIEITDQQRDRLQREIRLTFTVR
jgi:hypothetical protein